jgi:hypothetical protein
VQFSERSQTPAEARHSVLEGTNASAGQAAHAVAVFRDIAHTGRRTALRARRHQDVGGAVVAHAVAVLGHVTVAGSGAALGRALRIRRTVVADSVAVLGEVARTG